MHGIESHAQYSFRIECPNSLVTMLRFMADHRPRRVNSLRSLLLPLLASQQVTNYESTYFRSAHLEQEQEDQIQQKHIQTFARISSSSLLNMLNSTTERTVNAVTIVN